MMMRSTFESGAAAVLAEPVGGVGSCERAGAAVGADHRGGYQMARGMVETKCVVVRRQAEALLAELIRERAEAEDRQSAARRSDPFKLVAGSSSLDRAIDETRGLLRRLDEAEKLDG